MWVAGKWFATRSMDGSAAQDERVSKISFCCHFHHVGSGPPEAGPVGVFQPYEHTAWSRMALIELPRKWPGKNHGVVVETANIGQT